MSGIHAEYLPNLKNLYYSEGSSGYQFYAQLNMPVDSVTANGAPQVIYTCITL